MMRQRDKIYRYRLLALVMTVVLMLCSCGGGKDGKASSDGDDAKNSSKGVQIVEPENPVRYSATFTDLAMPAECYALQIMGQTLYGMTAAADGEGSCFYKEELDGTASYTELMTSSVLYQEIRENALSYFMDEEGHLYFILRKEGDTSGKPYYLSKCDTDGQELMRVEIAEQLDAAHEEGDAYQAATVDAAGNLYIATYTHIYLYEGNGEYHGELTDTGVVQALGIGRDGKVYYAKKKEMQTSGEGLELIEVDFEGKKAGNTYQGFPESYYYGDLQAGIRHDFLILDEECLYGYQLDTQTTERILTWSEFGMSGQGHPLAWEQENGEILVVERLYPGMQLVRFAEADGDEELPERETITIGLTCYDERLGNFSGLQKAVSQFNMAQDQYEVVFQTYGETVTYGGMMVGESRDGMEAMTLEMVSGKGPDLIARNSSFPIYAKRGFLEDLNDYLEKSGVLSREDYLEATLELNTFDGKLTSLPLSFLYTACYGYTDQIGEKTGRSLAEYMELIERYQDMPLLDAPSPQDVLIHFANTVYSYIDWENGTCSFETEGFKELLEYCKNGPKTERTDSWIPYVMGEDYLLGEIWGGVSSTMAKLITGNVTLIGYPVEEGNGSYLQDTSSVYALGISSQSRHKEGAWTFLEYLYTKAGLALEGDFPARMDALEKRFSKLVGTTYTVDDAEYVVTEEHIEFLWDLLENASLDYTNIYSNIVIQIVFEEVNSYFAGDKSVEDVMDGIQNRIQLYLSENF